MFFRGFSHPPVPTFTFFRPHRQLRGRLQVHRGGGVDGHAEATEGP